MSEAGAPALSNGGRPPAEVRVDEIDVVVYLDPPHNAVVVSVDGKSQIQALDPTQPILPVMPGVPERQTHPWARRWLRFPRMPMCR